MVSQGSRTVGRKSGMSYSLTLSCLSFLFLREVSSNTENEDSLRRNETTRARWNSTSVMSRSDCLTYSNIYAIIITGPNVNTACQAIKTSPSTKRSIQEKLRITLHT